MGSDTQSNTRTVDRSAEAPAGAGGPVAHHNGHGKGGTLIDVPITTQQVTQASKPAADASKQAAGTLGLIITPEVQKHKPPRAKPGTDKFVEDMAGVQEKFGPQLGHLNTDPARMRERVSVAQAADQALGPVSVLAGQLTEIANMSLDFGKKEASAVYRRALAVADAFPDIAKAIAPYRSANARVAQKAQASRKKSEKAAAAKAATPAVPPAPVHSTSTTVTTTEK